MHWMRRLGWFSWTAVLACSSSGPATGTRSTAVLATTPTAVPALAVGPATSPPAPAAVNPFDAATFYVNPDYTQKVEATAKKIPESARSLSKLSAHPTALWLDSIAALQHVPRWLSDAATATKLTEKPVVPVFVVYDLPNRDCAAKSSAGELTIERDGERRYRTEFIDALAQHFRAHGSQRIVAILEPDSLPNVATNLSVPKCAASADVYRASVAYAVSKLSLPNVFLYLDAAHAGWLGWDGNRAKIAQIFKEVLLAAGGVDRIRGFATNVSNYNVLQGDDGAKLEPTNPCPNELTYVQKLAGSLAQVGIVDKGFIVDTSRNGRAGIRSTWANWCNIRGAGLGERPRVAPGPLLDAYFWVKPPGESDGTSNSSARRFDSNCTSADAAAGAPEAGQWFQSHLFELIRNANPPLE